MVKDTPISFLPYAPQYDRYVVKSPRCNWVSFDVTDPIFESSNGGKKVQELVITIITLPKIDSIYYNYIMGLQLFH